MKLAPIVAILFLILPLGLTAKADHCYNYQRVASAAHQLDSATNHFHHVIHHLEGYSHLARDVHELAEAAAYFHDEVEYGADCYFIESEFDYVSQMYRHVRRMLHHAHDEHHNPHVMHDWSEVEWAYNRLYQAVGRW